MKGYSDGMANFIEDFRVMDSNTWERLSKTFNLKTKPKTSFITTVPPDKLSVVLAAGSEVGALHMHHCGGAGWTTLGTNRTVGDSIIFMERYANDYTWRHMRDGPISYMIDEMKKLGWPITVGESFEGLALSGSEPVKALAIMLSYPITPLAIHLPELGLSPKGQRVMMDRIIAASKRVPVTVVTNSKVMLDHISQRVRGYVDRYMAQDPTEEWHIKPEDVKILFLPEYKMRYVCDMNEHGQVTGEFAHLVKEFWDYEES